jgi:CRP/FNR family cyclic AMP-dependent transcriptional regulator
VRTLVELMQDLPALRALGPDHRVTIAGCAGNAAFGADDEIMREGDPADAFYVIRKGAVAIVTDVPGRGAVTLETLHAGDLLGWSWLLAPYRNEFGARALGTTHLLGFDAACLRGKCDADPALGYDLLKLLAAGFAERLRDTRLRLLDLYGTS